MLSDLAANSVIEVLGWKKVDTAVGEAIVLTIIETEKQQTGETTRKQKNLMIPERFEGEMGKIPCVAVYGGKKEIKGGKTCHDLRFVKPSDKELFRDDDPGEKPGKPRVKQPPPDPEADDMFEDTQSAWQPIPCQGCQVTGSMCCGFCPSCGRHQPPDGSQCPC